MYWPLGAPRVYASTKLRLPDDQLNRFDDDEAADSSLLSLSVHTNGTSQTDCSSTNSSSLSVGSRGDDATPDGGVTAVDEGDALHNVRTNSTIGDVEPEGDIAGEILGLRVTRNGSMFATITRGTLTIWQTKVRKDNPSDSSPTLDSEPQLTPGTSPRPYWHLSYAPKAR
jgi:RAB6A-GEF complex partner protein 1